ncbi:hypothetical protein IDJ77_10290 [Mucilaginibacter sp. ZT4R22]|uniref:Uncharacterized protein n=1 Tax=Mucilaginibacter pankratovii TaxID=2772110 RepID=A0ABR7WPE0_9SPHI|nr:hypothetical protein [Mucilaginibacter pankratovii]MBD1364198.1 hypothetical protein [Mucilaginibacter pankratovii]
MSFAAKAKTYRIYPSVKTDGNEGAALIRNCKMHYGCCINLKEFANKTPSLPSHSWDGAAGRAILHFALLVDNSQ